MLSGFTQVVPGPAGGAGLNANPSEEGSWWWRRTWWWSPLPGLFTGSAQQRVSTVTHSVGLRGHFHTKMFLQRLQLRRKSHKWHNKWTFMLCEVFVCWLERCRLFFLIDNRSQNQSYKYSVWYILFLCTMDPSLSKTMKNKFSKWNDKIFVVVPPERHIKCFLMWCHDQQEVIICLPTCLPCLRILYQNRIVFSSCKTHEVCSWRLNDFYQ